jgi:uncharacterized membrane protein
MKQIFLYIMALAYIAAGANHFINPKWYLRIMPPWLPAPAAMNYISGACEIVFALMLIPESTRSIGAWLLIALLVAVFPANVQMSIIFHQKQLPGFWLTVARLPLQIVLIWWAYQYTKL